MGDKRQRVQEDKEAFEKGNPPNEEQEGVQGEASQSLKLFSNKLLLGGIGSVFVLGGLFFTFGETQLPSVVEGDGYKAVLISAGVFTMGCTTEQGSDCSRDEIPAHKVEITRDFYLMESEVTQDLYQRVMGENPSSFKGLTRPVETISWYDAVKFANKLSHQEGLEQCYLINKNDVEWSNKDCNGWRLPTEAEWEFAARGLTTSTLVRNAKDQQYATMKGEKAYKYAGSDNLSDVAWYGYFDNDDPNRTITSEGTKDVCTKAKNDFGLCDMSGNVWEWTWDWYDETSYAARREIQDPYGIETGSARVIRGGSWGNIARFPRVSYRNNYTPRYEDRILGFRLGRTI